MEVIHDILKPDFVIDHPTTITIGNFDGVHKGHIEIIRRIRSIVKKNNSVPVVITFDPHPLSIISSGSPPELLSTTTEKLKLLEAYNIPIVALFPFNKRISQNSAKWFLENVLVGKLRVRNIVIGINHTFGRDREGNVEYLRKALLGTGIGLDVVKPLRSSGEMISSSAVRTALYQGDYKTASAMLGHPYPLFGKIIPGKGVGSTLGYPTINIQPGKHKLVPPIGVYACFINIKNAFLGGMLYIGTRPTFGGKNIVIEIACFSSLDVKAGDTLEVYALKYFRADVRFRSQGLLVDQIKKDQKAIRNYLRRRKIRLT